MALKAIFRLGYLTPVRCGVSFNNLKTIYDVDLKIGFLTLFDVLNTMEKIPTLKDPPKAIFRLGYLAPVLCRVALYNLKTVYETDMKICFLKQLDMLNMMKNRPQSENAPKSYF